MQAVLLKRELDSEIEKFDLPSNAGNPEFDGLTSALRGEAQKVGELIQASEGGKDLGAAREAYREAAKRARDLFAESLAIATAPALRALRLDNGASAIVDRMLAELGGQVDIGWRHITTVADSEFFGTASQVIRLRYPAPTIWEIPVAAHEFGHFAGPRWPASREESPYQAFRNVQDLGGPEHLEEFFADLFAAFAVGPAYIYTCLLLRFDPTAEDGTHPSDRKRAEWLLTAFDLLTSNTGPAHRDFMERKAREIREEWTRAVSDSGAAALDPRFAAALRLRAVKLWKGFASWRKPYDVERAMVLRADYFDRASRLAGAPAIRDVLNAAWLIRVGQAATDLKKASEIEKWARTLCSQAA